MKIRPVGSWQGRSKWKDGQTGMAKLIIAFRTFAKSAQKETIQRGISWQRN